MSETPTPKMPKAGVMRRKVGGVPVVYLVGGFVAVLVVLAWRMKPSSDVAASDAADAVDAGTDAAIPSGSGVPPVPSGTVIVAPQQPPVEDAPYEDNSTWMRKGVTFLISKGKNPGAAQLALQHYLAGNSLSYAEGEMRDMVVREYGLPPDGFDAGPTAPKPASPSTPTPAPVPPVPHTPAPRTDIPTPTAKPPVKTVPKPTPPPRKYHVVRPGENLTVIGRKYGKTWQQLYALNKSTIKNPNLIYPNQRIRVS